jgi:hypothetical protein
MNNNITTSELDTKRKYYLLSKQSLARLIGINGNLFRDILGLRKPIPKKYLNKIEDFIDLPLDDYIKKYKGVE